MDPTLAAILVNLLSQVLWQLGSFAVDSYEDGDEPTGMEEALGRAQDEIRRVLPEDAADRFAAVLDAAETRATVRTLYLHRLSDSGSTPDAARAAFYDTCDRHGIHEPTTRHEVFDALVRACDLTLDVAISAGVLAAHEAKAAIRHKLLVEQLRALELRLDLIRHHESLTEADIVDFGSRVRDEMHVRTGEVTPPDFYGAPRVPIDKIYVTPHLTIPFKDGRRVQVAFADWLPAIHRVVVLGNPGAGKSTLARRVCYELTTSHGEKALGGQHVIPFIVTLREYGADKKQRPISIARHVAEKIHTRFQLPHAPDVVEYMLLAGRLFIVFDGLDELLDANYRREIREDVESFSRRYPNVPLLVTSRERGYEAAPLDSDRFNVFYLMDFDTSQVSEYAMKWFALDEELSERQKVATATSFVEESSIVPDLRSNPLMLALMCNFYRGQNYIPRNRPDVYEKCSKMLFDTWDRQRDIKADLPIEEHIEPAMQFLAQWIYEDERRQGGVTESELVDKAAEFLLKWRFDDIHKAQHAARAFIEFCRGRAWVFTDTGSTEQELLYQFTHRTFLEYFTARYLVASHSTSIELARTLLPRIARGEWDVVSQLAFQIRSRAELGGADQLLQEAFSLVEQADSDEAARVLTFSSRCLRFLVPTPDTARRLAKTVTDLLLRSRLEAMGSTGGSAVRLGEELSLALGALMASSEENREPITDAVVQSLAVGLRERREEAGELVYHIVRPLFQWSLDEAIANGRVEDHWVGVGNDLMREHQEDLEAMRTSYEGLALDACRRDELGIDRLLDLHGIGSFFRPRRFIIWSRSLGTSLADWLLRDMVSGETDRHLIRWIPHLARIFERTEAPWLEGTWVGRLNVPYIDGRRRDPGTSRVSLESADELFVAFCILAVYVEARVARFDRASRTRVRSSVEGVAGVAKLLLGVDRAGSPLAALMPALRERAVREQARVTAEVEREGPEYDQLAVRMPASDSEIDDIGVTDAQRRIVTAWAEHRLSFLRW